MSLTEVHANAPGPDDEPSGAFSKVLRARTAAVHDNAEHSPLMSALMEGDLDRASYAQLVGQLYFLYRAIEDTAATLRSDPVAAPFLFTELTRVPALESDLDALLGTDWRDAIAPLPSTTDYVDRVLEVGTTWPGGFIAHHYTRYLGDLSGGFFIGGVVRRTYDLTPEHGASFYAFDEIASPKAFKQEYRELLDEAPWDADEQEAIVGEIVSAYGRNSTLLADVWSDVSTSA